MNLYELPTDATDEMVLDALPPLWRSALATLCERGSTRCNDGAMVDDLLSSLCSKPSLETALAKWEMNPNSLTDGYISLYTPTERGRRINALCAASPWKPVAAEQQGAA